MTETTHEQIPEAVRETRLTQLCDHLNDRYGLDLARWYDPGTRLALVVSRDNTDCDVIVGVYVDPYSGLFRLEAYTRAGWLGRPFQRAERDAMQRAARWVFQFIPETPADTP
jgi:hypothetical protein